MNPVRANIVKKPEEWRWSSAQEHINGRTDGTINLYKWMGDEEREEYAKMVVEGTVQEEIRKATSTGRPLWREEFFNQLETILKRDLKPKKEEDRQRRTIIRRLSCHWSAPAVVRGRPEVVKSRRSHRCRYALGHFRCGL
jgi:putative transposase